MVTILPFPVICHYAGIIDMLISTQSVLCVVSQVPDCTEIHVAILFSA